MPSAANKKFSELRGIFFKSINHEVDCSTLTRISFSTAFCLCSGACVIVPWFYGEVKCNLPAEVNQKLRSREAWNILRDGDCVRNKCGRRRRITRMNEMGAETNSRIQTSKPVLFLILHKGKQRNDDALVNGRHDSLTVWAACSDEGLRKRKIVWVARKSKTSEIARLFCIWKLHTWTQ